MVGDLRQVTYLTHPDRKFKKYQQGKLLDFVKSKDCKVKDCEVDEGLLAVSHRNNQHICDYSSLLFPELVASSPCACCSHEDPLEHSGIFGVRQSLTNNYLSKFSPMQLRWSALAKVDEGFPSMNLGEAKGLTFDRVLIYLTKSMKSWINDHSTMLKPEARAKFYVGLTRARNSVAFVLDDGDSSDYEGVTLWEPGGAES